MRKSFLQKTLVRRRHLLAEQLERRELLALDLPFQNPIQRFDVNQDLMISAVDALQVINLLGRQNSSDPLPDVNDTDRFPDVNGSRTATALDALQIINRLGVPGSSLSGRLIADSAPGGTTNKDFVTNSYSLEFGITRPEPGDAIEARINGQDSDPFVDATNFFDAGTMRLEQAGIDQVAGTALVDGENRFEFRIAGVAETLDFMVTVDRAAPDVTVAVDPTVRESFDALTIQADEPIANDVNTADLFELVVVGGPNNGSTVPITSADQDQVLNTTQVKFDQTLADQSYQFNVNSPLSDVAGNQITLAATMFTVADPVGIGEVSPAAGERLVNVNRETIVRFDEPVDPDTITGGGNTLIVPEATAGSAGAAPIHVIAGGKQLGGRLVVSSTERFATFYYDNPLPASTEVRVVVDGGRIIGRDGLPLDADGDNQPGGQRTADFRTLPIGPVAGTGVFGFVRDSTTDEPIVGATIRVDNLLERNVVTDANGRFELVDLPAPQVFVHIDGSTATNLPAGFAYPNVGKPFHTTAGQVVQVNHDDNPFDIFLPRLKDSDIQDLSATEPTSVGFGDDGKARLEAMFPDVDPTLFDELELRIEPGAAVDDLGNPATRAAIIPVDPLRIPAPLPSFLDPELVISIQVPGATSFDIPAEITFPNLRGLAPGEQAQIFSFDHDKGEWKQVGTGTVSEDGRTIVSNGGVIQAPGWHDVVGGSTVRFGQKNEVEEVDEPSVFIQGANTIFSQTLTKSQILVANTSDVPITIDIIHDNIDKLTKLSTNVTKVTLGKRETITIDLQAAGVSDEAIAALQDDDPDTTHAKIITGSVKIVAKGDGAEIGNETYLYGLIVAKDAALRFPVPLDEEVSPEAEAEQKKIILEVTGPADKLSFDANDSIVFVDFPGSSAELSVPALDLVESLQNGTLTLGDGNEELGTVNVNAADALQLNPFAIRRVSGDITGDIAAKNFSINGEVEIGLAGPIFNPLFKIIGSLIVTSKNLELVGKITTDLLASVPGIPAGTPGFGPDVVLLERTVLTIDFATRKVVFNPKQEDAKDKKEDPASGKQLALAGMKVAITDLFFPQQGFGFGVRGSITLPDKLGNVKIEIGDAENDSGGILISGAGVEVLGAKVAFPNVDFTIFGVDASASNLMLEFRKQGIENGVPLGDRFVINGDLDLKFPKFDPNLRIAASFAQAPAQGAGDALIDLDDALGPAWAFALAEQQDLAAIDAAADQPPDLLDEVTDSFIRIEALQEGGFTVDAVGRLAVENVVIGPVTIENAFLTIDTVNDNYLGFARADTPVGKFNAMLGFEGGNLDLFAVGVENLAAGRGIPIGTTPLFLRSIGGGLKDISQGAAAIDLIAAFTATAGPATPQLFPAFSVPSYLGGFSFDGANLLQIDVGGNIGFDELNLGGQVVIGGDASGGFIKGVGKIAVDFNDPSLKVEASLEALGGLVTIGGFGGKEFATLTVNSNFDVVANGEATVTLPQNIPFPLKWASGRKLASASAAFKFSNDGVNDNNFLAFWGTVGLFVNPITGNQVSATAGVQVFTALKLPNFITSTAEANQISGEGEGEFSGEIVFQIPAAKEYSIFSTDWEIASATAKLELVDPSGNTITEDQFAANPNVFLLSSSDTGRDVAVFQPEAGNWTVRVVDANLDDLGNVQFAGSFEAPLPTIDLTSATLGTGALTVDFDTTETTTDAIVSIFVDTDRNNFDGTLVADNVAVAANGSGTDTIDFDALNLPPGDYFIYAQLDQAGKPLELSEYFVGGFTVTDPNALPSVENVSAEWIGGNQFEVAWDPLAGADAYVIHVTDNASGIDFQQSVNVDGNNTSVVFNNGTLQTPLLDGETYRIAVSGLGIDGVRGGGDGQTVTSVGVDRSVAPESGQFPIYAVPGETFTGQLAFTAGDVAELVEGPAGSTVDPSTGQFAWDVPNGTSGFVDVIIRVMPADGVTRYDEFILLASAIPIGIISAQAFDDTDRDGQKAAAEVGSNGITIELLDAITGAVLRTETSADVDLSGNTTIDPTTESGVAVFGNLNPGQYVLHRTDVLNQDQTLTVSDATTTFAVLGDRSNATVEGIVLLDDNFDGTGDTPVAGISVGLDLDGNGSADVLAVTAADDPDTPAIDETGTYQFGSLLAGDFDVIVLPPVDFGVVGSATANVNVAADEQLQGIDFTLVIDPVGEAPSARILDVDQMMLVFSQIGVGEILADGPGGDMVTINLELMNLGVGNLNVSSVVIADAATGFSTAGIEAGAVVVPEAFLETSSALPFTLSFDPLQSGSFTTTLTIETNDPNSPLLVQLHGTAIADGPELSLVTANNNAGGAAVGTTETRTEFFGLSNIGSQSLTITAVSGSLGFAPSGLPAGFPAQPIVLQPGETMSYDLDLAPSLLGLQSGALSVASDDVNRPLQTQFLVATGTGPNGPSASIGEDFVAIATPSVDGSPVLRDITGPAGEYQFSLTPNVSYEVVVFDPDSGLVAKSLDLTAASGETGDVIEPFYLASTAPDTDFDTLPDDIEFAIGTSITNPDTDGDGVNDFAEILQGLNPLSGLLVGIGIIASLPLPGEVNEVVLPASTSGQQLAFLATGSHGLAIVDVSDVLAPITLGLLELPGDAVDVDVDLGLGLVAVATGTELQIVDISDPMIPTIAQTVITGASQVEVLGGIAYIAGRNTLASVDLVTGEPLTAITGGNFTEIRRLGNFLYTMETENTLRVFELEGLNISERGSLNLSNGGGRLFVGGGIAFVSAADRLQGGFSTVDISDPLNPTLISNSDVTTGVAPKGLVIPNGSGLGVVLGNPLDTPILDVVDLSDPTNTDIFDDTFRTRVDLPAAPVSGTIGAGIAFVANGASGLQIVNFLAFDDQELPPTIDLSLPVVDVDGATAGIQVFEGMTLPLMVDVVDDVQVRSVDLLLDGQVIASDISFPFDLTTFAPALVDSTSTNRLTFLARATDTGGNTSLSDPIILDVIEDTLPPTIESISIVDGSTIAAGFVPVVIEFSEPIAETTINSTNFSLTEIFSGTRAPLSIIVSPDQTSVRVTYQLTAAGSFQFSIDAASVTDRGGNPLGANPVVTGFTIDGTRANANPIFPEINVKAFGSDDVIVDDFNADGIPDLATANSGFAGGRAGISLGRGDGTFDQQVEFEVADLPKRVVSGDFNGDGKVDLIVSGNTADLSLLLGLGDGTFAPHTLIPIGASINFSISIDDIDDDGDDDVVALGGNNSELRILLGNGDGTFGDVLETFVNISFARSLVIADFDEDTNLDIAISGTSVGLLLGNGDGTFADVVRFNGIGGNVVTKDVNDDGDLDLINNVGGDIAVSLGDGNGGFGAATKFSVPDSGRGLVIDDFDGNGTFDVATLNDGANGSAVVATVSVLLGDGNGGFGDETRLDIGRFPNRLVIGDINLDGNSDFLLTGETISGDHGVAILIGVGDGTFRSQKRFLAAFDPAIPQNPQPVPFAVTLGDANNDNVPDIFTANSSDDISVLIGDGDGSFADQVKFQTGGRPIAIVADHFDGNANLDIITANVNSNDVSVLSGNGQGAFAQPVSFALSGTPTTLAKAKLDAGISVDLVIGLGANQVAVLLGVGDGTFAAEAIVDAGSGQANSNSHISIADVDNDGNIDILSANRFLFGGGSITVMLGAGDGTFADGLLIANVSSLANAAADDINKDGIVDIVATRSSGSFVGEAFVFFGLQAGGFSAPTTIVDGAIGDIFGIRDVDGDQNLDLVITGGLGGVTHEISVLLGNGSGAFADPQIFGAGQRLEDLVFGDLNGDGGLDIVTVHSESRDVAVLLNQQPPVPAEGEGESSDNLGIVARNLSNPGSTLDQQLIDSLLSEQDWWLQPSS